MASTQNVKTVNLIAGEDLRDGFALMLTLENDSGVAKVIKTTDPLESPVGILAENPQSDISTDGLGVPVALFGGGGVLKVTAGGTITAGQLLVADTDAGRVVGVADQAALVADTIAVGVALESAVDGDIFEMLAQVQTSSTET